MSRASRRKGARAELELAAILAEHGHRVKRTQRGDRQETDLIGIPGVAIEVKRCERLDIPGWCRQVEAAASRTDVPVVAFRRSREPWRVVLLLEDWLDLLEEARS